MQGSKEDKMFPISFAGEKIQWIIMSKLNETHDIDRSFRTAMGHKLNLHSSERNLRWKELTMRKQSIRSCIYNAFRTTPHQKHST